MQNVLYFWKPTCNGQAAFWARNSLPIFNALNCFLFIQYLHIEVISKQYPVRLLIPLPSQLSCTIRNSSEHACVIRLEAKHALKTTMQGEEIVGCNEINMAVNTTQ